MPNTNLLPENNRKQSSTLAKTCMSQIGVVTVQNQELSYVGNVLLTALEAVLILSYAHLVCFAETVCWGFFCGGCLCTSFPSILLPPTGQVQEGAALIGAFSQAVSTHCVILHTYKAFLRKLQMFFFHTKGQKVAKKSICKNAAVLVLNFSVVFPF